MQIVQVQLVSEADEPIGITDVLSAHRGAGLLHRAVSVFLFRANATGQIEVLLQKRSQTKIVGAGQWANTVCGNCLPGEAYTQCAQRRLWDELGIAGVALEEIAVFRYQVRCNAEFGENEIDYVFVGWFDARVAPNPAEVAAVRWIEWSAAKNGLQELESEAPWYALLRTDKKIVRSLDSWLAKKTK